MNYEVRIQKIQVFLQPDSTSMTQNILLSQFMQHLLHWCNTLIESNIRSIRCAGGLYLQNDVC